METFFFVIIMAWIIAIVIAGVLRWLLTALGSLADDMEHFRHDKS